MTRNGYSIDVFSFLSPHTTTPKFESRNVRFIDITNIIEESAGLKKNNLKISRLWILFKRAIRKLFNFIGGFAEINRLYKIWTTRPYSFFIVVEPEGIPFLKHIAYKSSILYRFLGIPFIYLSLELILSYELFNPRESVFKKLERVYSKRSFFNIIQDKDRGKLFAQDNFIPMHKLEYLPNSPLMLAEKSKSRYWHQEFGLEDNIKVVLHPGDFAEWTTLEDVISSTQLWPTGWILVIHTTLINDKMPEAKLIRWEFLKKLASGNPKVVFSQHPASRQKYDKLVSSADVIIAFPTPTGNARHLLTNMRVIGLSSGKASYALRSGLPVIVNNKTTLGKFVTETGCGVSVETASEIGSALRKIESNYKQYSEMAYKTFEEHLQFEKHFKKILRRIEKYL